MKNFSASLFFKPFLRMLSGCFLILASPIWANGVEKKCADALIREGFLQKTDALFFTGDGEVDPESFYYAGNRYGREDSDSAPDFLDMAETHGDLRDLLDQYLREVDGPLLEIGPLFSPMLDPAVGSQKIVYWERDLKALRRLAARARSSRRPRPEVHPLFIDLNASSALFWNGFSERNRQILGQHGSYAAVLISQVLNYVNYQSLLRDVVQFQRAGDLIFINNTLHFGDTDFLHPRRPFASSDILVKLKRLGYTIVETREDEVVGRPTLSLVARKN